MLFYLKLFYMILCIGSNIVIATHFRHNHGRITARAVSSIITKLPNDYRNSSKVAIFDAKNHRRSARSMPVSNENRNLSMYNLDKNSIIFLKTYLRFEAALNQDSGLKFFLIDIENGFCLQLHFSNFKTLLTDMITELFYET